MMPRCDVLELIQKSGSTQQKTKQRYLTTPNSLPDSEIKLGVIDEDMFNGFQLIIELEF
jgi:hypothetical protein